RTSALKVTGTGVMMMVVVMRGARSVWRWGELMAATAPGCRSRQHYLWPAMSTQELREKAHKAVDAVPDDRLQHFVAILEQVKEMLDEAEFDTRVKRII